MTAITIARTEIVVTSSDSDYTVPGDMTPAQVVTAYSSQIPGLSSMTSTDRVEARDGVGNVRVITFSPRTGTKGAVQRTEIIVTSSDSDYTVPGDMSPAQVVTAYSSQIPGLSGMSFTDRVENREDVGDVRIITFSPRTGTKGAVQRTEIIVTSSDSDYTVPGDMSPAQVVTAYSSQIPGLSGMSFTDRVETRDDVGDVRIITFSPRTGTKG